MVALSEIEPANKGRVIDLVRAAGVDVGDWGNYSRGPAWAAANPKYCYEWSFVEPAKAVVLNLWFSSMELKNGKIIQRLRPREWGRVIGESVNPVWASRARKIDEAIHLAYSNKLPVRVIVCDGVRRNLKDPYSAASEVRKRALDPVPWTVTSYSFRTSECTITRGDSKYRYIDQFSLSAEDAPWAQRRSVEGAVFIRDERVRAIVRDRAKGNCELCGQEGFLMADGRIYIETHHVIPLSEKGRDHVANVVALCPNHHREAHHGSSAPKIRKAMQKHLSRIY